MLVITIVVLLILAGILIKISIGEDGLIKRAITSKEQYEKTQLIEEIEQEILNLDVEKIIKDEQLTIEQALTEIFNKDKFDKIDISNNIGMIEEYKVELGYNEKGKVIIKEVNKEDSEDNDDKEIKWTECEFVRLDGYIDETDTLVLYTGSGWEDSFAIINIKQNLHDYSQMSVTYSYTPGYTFGLGFWNPKVDERYILDGTDGHWPYAVEKTTKTYDIIDDCNPHKIWFRAGSINAKLYIYKIELIK